jgi:hypothetical protein
MQMTNEEKLAYELFDKRKRACERNSKNVEKDIVKIINDNPDNIPHLLVRQAQLLRDVYYYGVEPDIDVSNFIYSLDDRSIQSWEQFKRLYVMVRQYDDGQEIHDAYFGEEGLKITSLDASGERTELSGLIEIIRDMDAYQMDMIQVEYVIDLYNDDTRRIGVFLEAEKVDEIIAKRSKTVDYLEGSELGDFV